MLLTNYSDSFNHLEFRIYNFSKAFIMISFSTAQTEKKLVEKICKTNLWKDLIIFLFEIPHPDKKELNIGKI